MIMENNKQILQKFIVAAQSLDDKTVAELMHPEFVVHEAAGLPYAGEYRGLDGWQRLFSTVIGIWKDVSIKTEMYIGADDADDFAVLMIFSGKSPDGQKPFQTRILEHWRLQDRKVIEIWPHYWDTHAMRVLYEEGQPAI
jgi:ketosteroid isomerase-like protein